MSSVLGANFFLGLYSICNSVFPTSNGMPSAVVKYSAAKSCSNPYSRGLRPSSVSGTGEVNGEGRCEGVGGDEDSGGDTVGGKKTHSSAGGSATTQKSDMEKCVRWTTYGRVLSPRMVWRSSKPCFQKSTVRSRSRGTPIVSECLTPLGVYFLLVEPSALTASRLRSTFVLVATQFPADLDGSKFRAMMRRARISADLNEVSAKFLSNNHHLKPATSKAGIVTTHCITLLAASRSRR